MSSSFGLDSLGTGGGAGVLDPPLTRTKRKRRRPESPPPPPPRDPDDSGGGGGGGGDGDESDGEGSPFPRRGQPPSGTAELALTLVLAGITTLFVVFLAVWVLFRSQAGQWPPPGHPPPSSLLWINTLVLLTSSIAIARAVRFRKGENRAAFLRWLGTGLLLGLGFLLAQALLWRELSAAGMLPSTSGYGAIFYALTGLHAVHVLIGVVYLAALWLRTRMRGFVASSVRSASLGAVYWHFMGGIWIVLFTVLYFV